MSIDLETMFARYIDGLTRPVEQNLFGTPEQEEAEYERVNRQPLELDEEAQELRI